MLITGLDIRTQLIRALNKPDLKHFRNGVLDFITSSELTEWQDSRQDAEVQSEFDTEIVEQVCAPWPGLYIVAVSLFCLYFLVMTTALIAYMCLTPQKKHKSKRGLLV